MKIEEVDDTGAKTSDHSSEYKYGGKNPDKHAEVPDEEQLPTGRSNGTEEAEGNGSGDSKDGGEGDNGVPELQMENGDFTFEDLEVDDRIVGTVRFAGDIDIKSDFTVVAVSKKHRKFALTSKNEAKDGVRHKNIRFNRLHPDCVLIKNKKAAEKAYEESRPDAKDALKEKYAELDPVAIDILGRIQAGVRNIWMVGPAGCGKSTIAQMVALALGKKFYLMSCGAGTSAAEIVGYKYPERAPTRFANYYKDDSIMTLDEFTALDPSVAQIANAALANGMLEITTIDPDTKSNMVKRHDGCVIIATSNTFGTGASLQYNANNQIDASTRDRFVGGVIEVDYNKKYEMQYDNEVVQFVWQLRDVIAMSRLQRIASTRMIISGQQLKKEGFKDWPRVLIADWTDKERVLLNQHLTTIGSHIKV